MAYDPPTVIGVDSALLGLAIIAVCLRVWVRLGLQPTYLGADDWLIFGAVVLLAADVADQAVATTLGIDGQSGDFPPDRIAVERKSDYTLVIIEKPLYAMMKLSVLFFYRRIFFVQKTFRWANNFMIGLVIAWAIAFTLTEIFVCGAHPNILWDPASVHEATTCVNQSWLDWFFSLTDVPFDLVIVLMPFPCIRKLQMGGREKASIAFIFSLGTLSTVAAVIRLYFISEGFLVDFGSEKVVKVSGAAPALWSTIEAGVGVIAACLPPLGPLIRKAPSATRAPVSLYRKYLSRLAGFSRQHSHSDSDGTAPDGGNDDTVRRPDRAETREKLPTNMV